MTHRIEFWLAVAGTVWVVVGWFVWLWFCWIEGTKEPVGHYLFSASFIAQTWPIAIVGGFVFIIVYFLSMPFMMLHEKVSEAIARRGREHKEGGIANSAPGKVVEEFGVRKTSETERDRWDSR